MLETHSTKATAVSESNNAGGRAPSLQRPTGIRGQSPRRCGDFTAFFKNTHF